MMNNKRILAIIPARGGSKGLPGKNIKEISGKPLIAWTLDAALESKHIDKVVVSTDSEEICDIARTRGTEVPFIRPDYLSDDNAKMMNVIFHCIDYLKSEKEEFDIIVLLQPTSPLRDVGDIDKAIEFFATKQAKAVVSVTECEHPLEWIGKLSDDLNMENFLDRNAVNMNRQELSMNYRVNGAIFIGNIEYLYKKHDWYGNETFAYVMKKEHSVDIDDSFDFNFARFLLDNRE